MKKLLAILLLLGASFVCFAADYRVVDVSGSSMYKEGDSYKPLEVGQILTKDTYLNISLNSNLKIAYGRFIMNIKPMKRGTVEAFTADIFDKHKVVKSNIAPGSVKSSKPVVTAASRASEAKDDIEWDEDEYYEFY